MNVWVKVVHKSEYVHLPRLPLSSKKSFVRTAPSELNGSVKLPTQIDANLADIMRALE